MGAYVLGIDTTALCPHGGTVTIIPSNTRVTASGAFVALQTDTTMVAGCVFMMGPKPSPCLTVQWVTAATRVTVNGTPVLLQNSVGLAVAPPPQGPVNVVSQQMRVTAT